MSGRAERPADTRRRAGRRARLLASLGAGVLGEAAHAGPPYVTDDPEPTDTGHWENYLYSQGASSAAQSLRAQAGIEINYGAAPDTQLTASVPLNPNPGPGGPGVVWAPLGVGVKYRFVQEDEDGWRPQVGLFPQVSIPVGPLNHGSPVNELLPIWLQKSRGAWTGFGGAGYTFNAGVGNRDYLIYGAALQRQLSEHFSIGGELFGQTSGQVRERAMTALGIAAQYDFSALWHLVGSVNSGIVAASQSDRFSYNLALKWTP